MSQKNEAFIKMSMSLIENKDLSVMEKLLYAILSNLSNRTGICTASNAYLADKLNVSIKTIERGFKVLREKNLIDTINIYENDTKRILKRDTIIVPSKMSIGTLNLSNSTLKNEGIVPSKMSIGTLADEGDKKINIKEENKRIESQPCTSSDAHSNDEYFNLIWLNHSEVLKTKKTKEGNPRKNSDKTKTRIVFNNLLNKYSYEAISCYVRNDTLKDYPKELINLLGKKLDIGLLTILNRQNVSVLDEALESSNADFLDFIEAIEENI